MERMNLLSECMIMWVCAVLKVNRILESVRGTASNPFPLERGAGSTMTYRTITIPTSSSIVKAPHKFDCSALNRFSLVRSVVWVLVIVQNVFRRNVARFNNTECKNWFHIQCVYVLQICYNAVQSLELWWTEDVWDAWNNSKKGKGKVLRYSWMT